MKNIILFVTLLFTIFCCREPSTYTTKEIYVWSHNDYEQIKPLYTALSYGIQMIEADIHLINGILYVAHDYPNDLENTPTLVELYLDPLAETIHQNDGVVLPGNHLPFYLVIDIKSEAESTYKALTLALDPYLEYLTSKKKGEWIEGPINLLISGNRPEIGQNSDHQLAFIDGRIPDLGKGLSPEVYPVISDNWFNYFSWDGTGDIPEHELTQLRKLVEMTHKENKLLRFWATPDKEDLWDVLIDEKVDIINVDDLSGISEYLNNRFKN